MLPVVDCAGQNACKLRMLETKVKNALLTSLYLSANRLAMVLFPLPIGPIRTMRGVRGASLLGCELMYVKVCEEEQTHGWYI